MWLKFVKRRAGVTGSDRSNDLFQNRSWRLKISGELAGYFIINTSSSVPTCNDYCDCEHRRSLSYFQSDVPAELMFLYSITVRWFSKDGSRKFGNSETPKLRNSETLESGEVFMKIRSSIQQTDSVLGEDTPWRVKYARSGSKDFETVIRIVLECHQNLKTGN